MISEIFYYYLKHLNKYILPILFLHKILIYFLNNENLNNNNNISNTIYYFLVEVQENEKIKNYKDEWAGG